MRMYEIIEKKRDGAELTEQELSFFIEGFTNGLIPDYQASALLMAIYLRGMTKIETALLTMLMARSGDIVDLSSIDGIKVDKHSTGGVGDKTTLVLAPIVAACGVPVAKMSGRGLGHTGGTIDKLEAIRGLSTSLTLEKFISNVKRTGLAVAGQTGNLAPADKKMYALRDVTATVSSIPLIASSIMSKKIASGADAIVLDVKTGSGAFMKTFEQSEALAQEMVEIGNSVGKKTIAIITNMDIPLGKAIGNSLEIIEAVDALKGKGPEDLLEVSLELSAWMLFLAGKGNISDCREEAASKVQDGSALKKLAGMISMQGGRMSEEGYDWLVTDTAFIEEILSGNEGYITSMTAEQLGKASVILGAGRETKEGTVDYAAGITLEKKPGDYVKKGDLLARIYTNRKESIRPATDMLTASITLSSKPVEARPLILKTIGI